MIMNPSIYLILDHSFFIPCSNKSEIEKAAILILLDKWFPECGGTWCITRRYLRILYDKGMPNWKDHEKEIRVGKFREIIEKAQTYACIDLQDAVLCTSLCSIQEVKMPRLISCFSRALPEIIKEAWTDREERINKVFRDHRFNIRVKILTIKRVPDIVYEVSKRYNVKQEDIELLAMLYEILKLVEHSEESILFISTDEKLLTAADVLYRAIVKDARSLDICILKPSELLKNWKPE